MTVTETPSPAPSPSLQDVRLAALGRACEYAEKSGTHHTFAQVLYYADEAARWAETGKIGKTQEPS